MNNPLFDREEMVRNTSRFLRVNRLVIAILAGLWLGCLLFNRLDASAPSLPAAGIFWIVGIIMGSVGLVRGLNEQDHVDDINLLLASIAALFVGFLLWPVLAFRN